MICVGCVLIVPMMCFSILLVVASHLRQLAEVQPIAATGCANTLCVQCFVVSAPSYAEQ